MFLTHGYKLNAHALTGRDVPDDRGAADFPFRDREQQSDRGTDGRWRCALNEEAADIQIPDARDALHTVMLPGDPDAFRRRDARVAAIALRRINQRS